MQCGNGGFLPWNWLFIWCPTLISHLVVKAWCRFHDPNDLKIDLTVSNLGQSKCKILVKFQIYLLLYASLPT